MALRVAVSLAAVLGLLWFLQRKLTRGPRRKRVVEPITVIARQTLGAKAQLVVVETGDVRYVLGVGEKGVTLVDRMPAGIPVLEEVRADPAPQPVATAPAAVTAPEPISFDRVLTASSTEEFTPQLRSRVRHRSDPLRGSILSPQTWRQTSEAIRRLR